ncbi:MlaD family protein [Nocardia sp. NPDC059228]|uniref:MlaD family protein n=1 Tax=Nocardia sp. NPDC059228 TaxID=3346777 RepID=UPI00368D493E
MKRLVAAIAVSAALCAASACGFDPSSVPVPGTRTAGRKYTMHIEFANVLNLPPGAKVIVNGVKVGDLESVRIVEPATGPSEQGYVVATVQLLDTVKLPTTTKAELRQATPLGDVHIALTTPPGDATGFYPADSTIPLAQTAQAPQVEDTLASISTFVGSGAINSIQDTVRQFNTVLPPNPKDTERIVGQLETDLADVGDNLQTVDAVLDGLQANVNTVLADKDIIGPMLTAAGADHEAKAVDTVVRVLFIFTALGPLSHQVVWLAPLVNSLDASASAFVPMLLGNRPLDLQSPANLRKLVDLIQHTIIPYIQQGPKVNVTATTAVDSPVPPAEQTARVIDTLRMIGAVR